MRECGLVDANRDTRSDYCVHFPQSQPPARVCTVSLARECPKCTRPSRMQECHQSPRWQRDSQRLGAIEQLRNWAIIYKYIIKRINQTRQLTIDFSFVSTERLQLFHYPNVKYFDLQRWISSWRRQQNAQGYLLKPTEASFHSCSTWHH